MPENQGVPDLDLADDLLVGAVAIARFLGKDARQIYYMTSKGQIPAFTLGSSSILHARKSTLLRHVEELERAALRPVEGAPDVGK